MMNIYFAINWDMINKFGMPEIETAKWSWLVSHDSVLGYHVKTNPGDLLKCLYAENINQSVVVCKAEVDLSQVVDCVECVLAGNSKKFAVVITQVMSCDAGRL